MLWLVQLQMSWQCILCNSVKKTIVICSIWCFKHFSENWWRSCIYLKRELNIVHVSGERQHHRYVLGCGINNVNSMFQCEEYTKAKKFRWLWCFCLQGAHAWCKFGVVIKLFVHVDSWDDCDRKCSRIWGNHYMTINHKCYTIKHRLNPAICANVYSTNW